MVCVPHNFHLKLPFFEIFIPIFPPETKMLKVKWYFWWIDLNQNLVKCILADTLLELKNSILYYLFLSVER